MEKKPVRPMTPFDEMTIPDEVQAVKLLLPYTPAAIRRTLAVFIKCREVQHTLEIFSERGNTLQSQESPSSLDAVVEEISPYLPPKSAASLNQFREILNILEMVQMFQEMGGFSEGQENAAMELLSPELSETLQMYQAMFSHTDPSSKGSDPNERMDE